MLVLGRKKGEPNRASQHGYTLIELLVVMAIMAMVLTAAPMVYGRVVPGAQLNGAARTMIADLRHAHALAARQGKDIVMSLEEEGEGYRIGEGMNVNFPGAIKATYQPLMANTDIENEIVFYGTGGTSGGEIILQAGRAKRRIEVDWLTGQAHIKKDRAS